MLTQTPVKPSSVDIRQDQDVEAVRKLIDQMGFKDPSNTPKQSGAELVLPRGYSFGTGADKSNSIMLTDAGAPRVANISMEADDSGKFTVVKDKTDPSLFRVGFEVNSKSRETVTDSAGKKVETELERPIEKGFIEFRKRDGVVRPTAVAWVSPTEENPAADGVEVTVRQEISQDAIRKATLPPRKK